MNRSAAMERGIGVGAACAVLTAVALATAARSVPLGLAVLLGVPLLVALAVTGWRRPVLAPAAAALLLVAGNAHLPVAVHLARLVTVVTVLIVLAARLAGRGRRIVWSPIIAVLALLIACAFLSTLTGVDASRSLVQDEDYLLGLALAAAVVMATVDRGDLLLLAASISLSGAVLCASALTSASDLQSRGSAALVTNRPIGVFAQPNELGLATGMTLCFSTAVAVLTFHQRRRVLTAVCGTTAVLALVALIMSLSRGAWIGTALGMVVLAVLLPEARRPLLMGLTGLVTVVLVQLVVLRQTTNIVSQRLLTIFNGQRNPYDDRPAIWAEAIHQVTEHPVLGTGPRNFPVAAEQSLADFTAARGADHAHNLLLTVGAEQGVLGAAGLVAAVTVGAWEALRNRKPPRARASGGSSPGSATDMTVRGCSAAAAAALAVVIGQGTVDYPLRNPITDTLTWLVIGLLAACARTRSATPDSEIRGGQNG